MRVALVALLLGLGIALRWHVLDVPFFSDDYMQLGMLAGTYPGEHAAWDLYSFIRGDPQELALHRSVGTLPWWTWEELNGSVLRPLSSLSLWFDWQLWPLNPRASHFHSLLWWCAMIMAASRLLFRLLPSRVAALALAIMVLDHGVSMNLGWVANRCTLICATFCFLAIESHLARRAAGARMISLSTLLWLSAGLLGGEYGLVAFAYLFALELLHPRGSARERVSSTARALWPAVIPMFAYLAWHMIGDYGTYGEAVYAHPLRTPLAYLQWLVLRLPRALAELLWSLPAGPSEVMTRPHFAWLGMPGLDELGWLPKGEWLRDLDKFLRVQALVASVLVTILLLIVRSALSSRDSLRPQFVPQPVAALALGATLGLLPVLVAPAHGRLFTLSQLGAASLLSTFFWSSLDAWRRRPGAARDLLLAPLVAYLVGVHLVADPAYSHHHLRRLEELHSPITRSLESLAGSSAQTEGFSEREVIVLSTLSHTAAIHGAIVLSLLDAPSPRRWNVISMSGSALSLQRVDDETLIVLPTGAPLLSSPIENFFRPARAPIARGDTFDAGSFRVEVLRKARTPTGDELPVAIKALRLRFEASLDDSRYLFLATDPLDGSLHEVEIPAAPGILLVERPVPGNSED
jgi:hypothetical protein